MKAEHIIAQLGLIAHPEGGYFRETYRSGATPMESRGATDRRGRVIETAREPPERNLLTSIYWMPTESARIGWLCSNRSDHVHYYQLGSAVTYYVLVPGRGLRVERLGPNLEDGDVLQLIVPGGAWKAAELEVGSFAVIGEAVAPGFDFRDFRWITEAEVEECAADRERLRRFIKPDQRRDFERYYDEDKAGSR